MKKEEVNPILHHFSMMIPKNYLMLSHSHLH